MRAGFRSLAPSYITEEDRNEIIDTFSRNGFKAPTRWYNTSITMKAAKDNIESKIHFPDSAGKYLSQGNSSYP
jgi:hypothetical protein